MGGNHIAPGSITRRTNDAGKGGNGGNATSGNAIGGNGDNPTAVYTIGGNDYADATTPWLIKAPYSLASSVSQPGADQFGLSTGVKPDNLIDKPFSIASTHLGPEKSYLSDLSSRSDGSPTDADIDSLKTQLDKDVRSDLGLPVWATQDEINAKVRMEIAAELRKN